MTEISKLVAPDGWRAARSLGSSQRALRNNMRKEAFASTRASIKEMKGKDSKTVTDIQNAGQAKLNTIAADYTKGKNMLKDEQKALSAPKRLVSNVAEYPARWTAGTAAVGGGTVASDRVRKSVGPFGVEVISKKEKDVSKDPSYRESIYQPINPRSKTYVKRGTGSAVRRVGGPLVGGSVGAVGGAALGGGTPASVPLSYAGAIGGASLMHTRNVRSGDTVGINRRTGKKAKSKVGAADVSVYNYAM